jgi:hypothetical protein
MSSDVIGISLMVAGAVLFVVGRLRSKRVTVHASKGSVAVGRDNVGQITNVNVGGHKQGRGEHALTLVSIFVEVVGIIVVFWHAMHLATK